MTVEEQNEFVDSVLDKVAEMANEKDFSTFDMLCLMQDRFDAWIAQER